MPVRGASTKQARGASKVCSSLARGRPRPDRLQKSLFLGLKKNLERIDLRPQNRTGRQRIDLTSCVGNGYTHEQTMKFASSFNNRHLFHGSRNSNLARFEGGDRLQYRLQIADSLPRKMILRIPATLMFDLDASKPRITPPDDARVACRRQGIGCETVKLPPGGARLAATHRQRYGLEHRTFRLHTMMLPFGRRQRNAPHP